MNRAPGLKSRAGRAAAALVGVWLACAETTVAAQTNLVGYWNPLFHEDVDERIPGPSIGDYLGLPISDAARLRAEAWDASLLSSPEHQCKPHPSTYGFRGVGGLRIWEDRDDDTQQLVKIHTHIAWQEQQREIWMDGRPPPTEYAPHSGQRFSTKIDCIAPRIGHTGFHCRTVATPGGSALAGYTIGVIQNQNCSTTLALCSTSR
jgi:hypothetical protein